MICKKCDFQNENNAQFCKNCGAELKQQQADLPKKKRFLLCVFLVVLIVVTGGLLMFLARDSSTTQNPDEMGKEIFSVITKINNISYSDFQKSFINADDCQILASQVSSSKTKENLLNNGYVESTYQMYNDDIEEGEVDWLTAEYVDWLYEYKIDGGIEGIMGILLVKVNMPDENCYMRVRAVAYNVSGKYKWVYWDRKAFAPDNAELKINKQNKSVIVTVDRYTERFELEEMFDSKGFLPYRR